MLVACNKLSWISSFDVVKIIRTHFQDKVGHSWTLDPMASWLMILWVWKGTKQLTELIWLDKAYETTIDFSLLTDTRDASFWEKEERFEIKGDWLIKDGVLIKSPNIGEIKAKLDSIIYQENKETLLPLPTFSAKKQNWRRLYKDARKWKAEIQEKQMKIYKYEILSYDFPYLKVRFSVGSWTYIRSIGYWLWKELWLWWALVQLERISIWKFNLSEIGTKDSAKGNIKWEERCIYYKELDLEAIKNPD